MIRRWLLRERQVQLSKKGLTVHIALLKCNALQDARFYINNLSEKPVNLPSHAAVCL